MTERILRAMECPLGRRARPPDRTPAAQARRRARRHGCGRHSGGATRCRDGDQLSGGPSRPQRVACRLAHERGVRLVVSTDAHSATALGNLRWGVQIARRAWVGPAPGAEHADTRRRCAALLRRCREDVTWQSTQTGFVSLKSLKDGTTRPRAALAEIRRIYFATTQADDRQRSGARHRAVEVVAGRGRAGKGVRLHGRPGRDAARMGSATAAKAQPCRYCEAAPPARREIAGLTGPTSPR